MPDAQGFVIFFVQTEKSSQRTHSNLMGHVLLAHYVVPPSYRKASDGKANAIGCVTHLLLMAPLNNRWRIS